MNGFTFQSPAALALLLLVPPVAWLLFRARKKRLALIHAMGGGLTTHRRLRDVLRTIALTLMLLALAKPGHSPQTQSVSRSGRDVVFALDVSQSMLAQDAKPSRLEVAKQAIRDALDVMNNQRVGLVIYAGSASILCPLTYDYDFARYMLDEVHPRTVEFGGTTLQAAVEKTVDQIFIDGRGNVQDLIVLTDGGDHGSKVAREVSIIEEKQVDVLLVGLGDPQRGSPIPIEDEEGRTSFLQEDGKVIRTKLDEKALQDLASRSRRITYSPVGIRPFHLGELYLDYAADKQTDAADGDTGITIYQDASILFLLPALVLLLLSELWTSKGLRLLPAAAILILSAPTLRAENPNFRSDFDAALTAFANGDFETAADTFSDLYQTDNASPAQLAAIRFNQGLCQLKLADAQDPQLALIHARNAQLAFLSAKQNAPSLDQAGVQLEHTSTLIATYLEEIRKREEQEQKQNEAMEQLIASLQALLENQQTLHDEVAANDVPRPNQRNRKQAPKDPVAPPKLATENAATFHTRQTTLHTDATAIETEMRRIDQSMRAPLEDQPDPVTIMAEPLQLIAQVIAAQLEAATNLNTWNTWPHARTLQNSAIRNIEKILQILAGDSDQDSEESEDWEEYEEDDEYMEDSDAEGMPSSQTSAELAAGAEMQALPVPNYSADEILQQEKGNLQFRQQNRAKANAGKVKQDY